MKESRKSESKRRLKSWVGSKKRLKLKLPVQKAAADFFNC